MAVLLPALACLLLLGSPTVLARTWAEATQPGLTWSEYMKDKEGDNKYMPSSPMPPSPMPPSPSPSPSPQVQSSGNIDPVILNFALNLEYLEANFYSCAAFGEPLDRQYWGANGCEPEGCKKALLSKDVQMYAEAIAKDEIAHVVFLRAALGDAAVDQPKINIASAFEAAANAALSTTLQPPFDAYGSDVVFLHAAFIFEDVGVTAYKGAAPLITNKDVLEAAAGILAVEAYHGGAIRTLLLKIAHHYVFPYGAQVKDIIQAISNLRAAVSGADDDQGIIEDGNYYIAPADKNAIAFSRSISQVLAIVTLAAQDNKGGFFPEGINQ